MISNHRTLLIAFFTVAAFIPVVVLAQGNHCVAQKSPMKMAVAAGQPVYVSKCQTCHQADGSGLPDKTPSLIKSKQITGDKRPLIELLISGHLQQPAVQGKKYSQTMPAYPEMSDDEIANVLTYIRRSFGNKGSLIKPSEVKSMRGVVK
ncbi:MAG: cytochrome c [Bacteroidota bacterium]|nr:cytochrome c [Bacteroidota bacterium]